VSDAAALPKAGNRAARRLLIEAAWSYRFPARLSRELLLRQELRARPEIIESTFDRVNIEFTTVFSYHIWWL